MQAPPLARPVHNMAGPGNPVEGQGFLRIYRKLRKSGQSQTSNYQSVGSLIVTVHIETIHRLIYS